MILLALGKQKSDFLERVFFLNHEIVIFKSLILFPLLQFDALYYSLIKRAFKYVVMHNNTNNSLFVKILVI